MHGQPQPSPSGTTSATPTANADRASFDVTAPWRAAVALESAPQYSWDAFFVAGKVTWMTPRLQSFRPRLLTLPEFDIAHLDRVEDLARALRYVQSELLRRIQEVKNVPVLAKEGWQLRGILMACAEAASFRGIIAPQLIARLREGSGYRDLVEDLKVLVLEFQSLAVSHPSEVNVKPAELERANAVAEQLNALVGNGADEDLTQTMLLAERTKLGALLGRSHSQLRRAIGFLRWDEGDAAELVPSLHVPAGRGKTASPDEQPPAALAALHHELHAITGTAHTPDEDNPFAPQE